MYDVSFMLALDVEYTCKPCTRSDVHECPKGDLWFCYACLEPDHAYVPKALDG